MNKHYEIWKKTTTTGCTFDKDLETKFEFFLICEKDEADFHEKCADDYSNQDYSYSVSYDKICELWFYELDAMKKFFAELQEGLQ